MEGTPYKKDGFFKRYRTWIFVAVAAFLLTCCGCFSIAALMGEPTPRDLDLSPAVVAVEPGALNTPRPTLTPLPAAATAISTATPDPNQIRPGTYVVGVDIHPGIYRGKTGFDLFDSCYWARLSGLGGQFSELIANENAIGQYYVEIKASDHAFRTECPMVRWQRPLSPTFVNRLDPGMYIVGVEIQPGLYQGRAGEDFMDSCYWSRLRNLSGQFEALIANDNATGQFFVEVAASDYALNTACSLTFARP